MADDVSTEPILRWTGHPLVDAGIAGLAAFSGRVQPEDLIADDLAEFARFAEDAYLSGDLTKTVGVLFTTNSFLNPSLKPPDRRERVRDAVQAYSRAGEDSLPDCAFCGRRALRVLHRDDVPMLLGRSNVNFYPGGQPGLPICGRCQIALHGLTVSAPRCSGKALVLFADDPAFLVDLVRPWVNRVRRMVQLAGQADAPPGFAAPRTRIVEALVRAQRTVGAKDVPVGLVAYYLSNSGQGPGIEIFPLPSSVVRFVQRANADRYQAAWSAIERRAWQRTSKKGGLASDLQVEERGEYRNYLYEDLFRLPDEAGRFIRLYFLRNPGGLVRRTDTDPRSEYRTGSDLDIINWPLVELFLKEVVGMDASRVTAIRSLGDRLAEEIIENNDRRLLRTAYQARSYATIRRLLLQADLRSLNRKSGPLFGLDDYLLVFEEGEELARVDWRLAWDLVLIRLIEQLHALGFGDLVKETVSAEDVAEPEESAEQVPA